ncbi:hypothetical protein I0E51_04525 [Pseudomonas lalucatii]|nr:hypothetical protein [Pseudomonas lalucatii]
MAATLADQKASFRLKLPSTLTRLRTRAPYRHANSAATTPPTECPTKW